jgi:CubicO group peptidase (beta-lactamase class C family)
MTVVAIVQLPEAGKIDLKAPVKDYLPEAAEAAASIPLHQLLTHHAGMTDSCGEDFAFVSKTDLLHRCMALPLAYPAKEDHYSNIGFSILTAVVE